MPPAPTNVWQNDAVTQMLKKLWAQGYSASVITAKINAAHHVALTRNMVIGKARRLHLMERKKGFHHPQRVKLGMELKSGNKGKPRIRKLERRFVVPRNAVVPEKQVLRPAPYAIRTDVPAPVAKITFAELTDDHCKFPVGDPRKPDFGFCGNPRVLGRPYCETCCARAYETPEVRARKPAEKREPVPA